MMNERCSVFCDNCDFVSVTARKFLELQHDLTDKGGAIVSDGAEGYISICPRCKEDQLNLYSEY